MQHIGVVLETLLIEDFLKPLAQGAGPMSQFGLAGLAQSIAERDDRFGALVEARSKP